MTAETSRAESTSWLVGGGEMGELIRAHDWSGTPLGPMSTWSPALRMMVPFLLANRFPHLLWWGPDYISIYNDPYRPVLGSKHPRALGLPVREVWSEIWHVLCPLIDTPFHGGPPTWNEDITLEINRHGFVEETHFTIAYSQVPDEDAPGGIGGVIATVVEITDKIIGERRIVVLRDLGARVGDARTPDEACAVASETLSAHPRDVPFALIYLVEAEGAQARLAGMTGVAAGADCAPAAIDLRPSTQSAWPIAAALETDTAQIVTLLRDRFSALPSDPWSEPPDTAVVLPIPSGGAGEPIGAIVVGISPRLALDEYYRDFLDLVRTQIATAVNHARAYEEERQRAEALAAIDRAKTAFFSNVSHEFRTPLTLIMGPVEDSLGDNEHPLTPHQRARQELIRRNGLRLQKLVNTLLDFSRIEAGRSQAAFAPTNLSALTTDLAGSFRGTIEGAGLTLLVDCPPLPERIYVDASMWEKIVLNLLSNAFKFTFHGTIRVALEWHGDHVELVVQDSGTGIASDELPRIFERFHRIDGSQGRSHEGTGIGLALVQELVGLHRGTVGVTSQLGEGSTFKVRIPAGHAHLPADRVRREAPPLRPADVAATAFVSEASQWSGGSTAIDALPAPESSALVTASPAASAARILVADDNADMRTYLSRLLSPRWTVDVATDGVEALAAIQAAPPDLVLADVMMPRMDGLELLRRIRADDRINTVPVVLLSARAGEEATIEGLTSGADEYLTKPFSARELMARVDAQLTASRLRREAMRAEREHSAETARLLEDAQRATRAREEVLAIVSHDLRNPLSALTASTDILARALGRDLQADDPIAKSIAAMRRSTTRMVRLVSDLLDIASIDSGTLALDVRLWDAGDLLREARDACVSDASQAGIAIAIDVEPGVPAMPCDKDRVLQVLGNLLANAVRFTAAGGRIEASARRVGDAVEIAVADSGCGIEADALAHIFDRHWQTARSRPDGHGLGLSIAKGIVDAHGGSFGVESEIGRGTTFRFSLLIELRVGEQRRAAASAP